MKILIVDDEPHIRHMLRFLFEKRGYSVITAETGPQAEQLVAADRPDVVFLDLNLPQKNGLDVCTAIRSRPECRDLPVYLLTAQGQDVDRERGLACGATDYITKPFSPSHLVELVQSIDRATRP